MTRLLPILILAILAVSAASCGNSGRGSIKNDSTKKSFSKVDTITSADTSTPLSGEQLDSTFIAKLKPIFGYRFVIKGDFDGDGKTETLVEHFFDRLTNKETNKFYDSLDYDRLVGIIVKYKDPFSFILSDNKNIDTLIIYSGGQLLGLSFLKNEGDLDGDGADEISYVVNWADWSNLNTSHLMTYKHNRWKELYSFEIWDWQLPDLPQTFNQYGPFGLQDKIINTTNDTTYQRLTKELESFRGFIKKIKTNKIQVRFRNEESMEDSTIVDLQRLTKKN